MKLLYFILYVILLIPSISTGEIYEYKNAAGKRLFSDHCNSTKQTFTISTQQSNQIFYDTPSAIPLKKTTRNHLQPSTASKITLPELLIVSPCDQQNFWNTPSLTVKIQCQLPPAAKLVILWDGNIDQHTIINHCITINHPTPGTHTLQAQLWTSNHQIYQTSQLITIYVHYTTTLPANTLLISNNSTA